MATYYVVNGGSDESDGLAISTGLATRARAEELASSEGDEIILLNEYQADLARFVNQSGSFVQRVEV